MIKQNPKSDQSGYSLFELIVTLVLLSILVMGTIPLAQNALKRQKEIRLRETLRQMRTAIDEFKRDTLGACPEGAIVSGNPAGNGTSVGGGGGVQADPRSRVVIDDCKIFEASKDNFDRYPPDLKILWEGVKVKSRAPNLQGGGAFSTKNATEINENKEIIKYYLREEPIDPFTGEADWKLRSSYQEKGSENWDNNNVFDVRSASDEEALNGEKYSDW